MDKAVDIDILSSLLPGAKGTIMFIDDSVAELHDRLRELGCVEGAEVEVLHTGPFGGDPLAIRVDQMLLALRRQEARLIAIKRAGLA